MARRLPWLRCSPPWTWLARPVRVPTWRFAADLLGGSDGETLRRKWDADVGLLTRNVATLLVLPVTAGFSVLLARMGTVRGTGGFARALRRLPLLRAGLWACVVAAGLGWWPTTAAWSSRRS